MLKVWINFLSIYPPHASFYIDNIFHAEASANRATCTHDLSLHCHFRLGFVIALVLLRWCSILGLWSTLCDGVVSPPWRGQRWLNIQLRSCWISSRSQLHTGDRWQGFYHPTMPWFLFARSVSIICQYSWEITSTCVWITLQNWSPCHLQWSG